MKLISIISCVVTVLVIGNMAQAKTDPLTGWSFYVDPNSNAKHQVRAWRETRPDDAKQLRKMAREPQGKWLGEWINHPKTEVAAWRKAAKQVNEVPVFVLYYIPQRDCGSYSSGGASSETVYRDFVDKVVSGIGNNKSVVIVEPDSLGAVSCLTKQEKKHRYALINYAVQALKTNAQTIVYIDAGNPNWVPKKTMAKRLNQAGIASADGFALNVSNFYKTKRNKNYGAQLSALVNNKHFVIDTSRNGLGPTSDYAWCNPLGRALGRVPTTNVKNQLVDALLWIKPPGESDGECNGGPAAGVWWAEYALGLAQLVL
ncbi:MAG: glycoside hydrolase family 6 protein [Patescibacteria group bacterium]|jgi:endoglucanase